MSPRRKSPGSSSASAVQVPRTFGEKRPIGHDGKNWVPTRKAGEVRDTRYQPLPTPPLGSNYHMDLGSVLNTGQMKQIQNNGKMVFHVNGDVGGIQDPKPQQTVADEMEADVKNSTDSQPSFLYLVGDVVYFTGQSTQYFAQFYLPYEHYPLPIFAIPGNHDGEFDPATQVPSLEAFMNNFCASTPAILPEAGEAKRMAMTQPYCYWTLDTPFATLIGLYTNVPEHGKVDADQVAWFLNEMGSAPKNKALILSFHHPIYSLDKFHAGSPVMLSLLQDSFSKAKRVPDLMLSGHVHNYQRFTWTLNGQQVPCIVMGNGGYHNLHPMAKDPDGNKPVTPETINANLILDSYDDTNYGFLRIEVDNGTLSGCYYSVKPPQTGLTQPADPWDRFTLDYNQGKYVL